MVFLILLFGIAIGEQAVIAAPRVPVLRQITFLHTFTALHAFTRIQLRASRGVRLLLRVTCGLNHLHNLAPRLRQALRQTDVGIREILRIVDAPLHILKLLANVFDNLTHGLTSYQLA